MGNNMCGAAEFQARLRRASPSLRAQADTRRRLSPHELWLTIDADGSWFHDMARRVAFDFAIERVAGSDTVLLLGEPNRNSILARVRLRKCRFKKLRV